MFDFGIIVRTSIFLLEISFLSCPSYRVCSHCKSCRPAWTLSIRLHFPRKIGTPKWNSRRLLWKMAWYLLCLLFFYFLFVCFNVFAVILSLPLKWRVVRRWVTCLTRSCKTPRTRSEKSLRTRQWTMLVLSIDFLSYPGVCMTATTPPLVSLPALVMPATPVPAATAGTNRLRCPP